MHPLLVTREMASHITHLTSKVRARTPSPSQAGLLQLWCHLASSWNF